MNRGQPVVLLLLLFLALGVVAQLVPLYTDWLWFQEVGYTEVFTKTLALRGSLFAGLALAVLVFLYVNLTFAARTAAPDVIWELEDQLGLPGRVVIEPLIRRFLPVVLFAISLVAGLRATVHWETLLRYFNALEFGRTDPLFGRDLSFFVFVLPFWRLLYGWAITLVVSTISVTRMELVAERRLYDHIIGMTRKAYGHDRMEKRRSPADETIDARALERNAPTIENIRLWDHRPLLRTFGQLQEIRTYYKFVDVDNDRYTMNGEYKQLMLSTRELSYAHLQSRIWINEHLTFTHGYGVVVGPVNRITPEGLPEFLVKDIPPQSTGGFPAITRPEIYFGEVSNEYALVRTRQQELNYPSGDQNVYTTYAGTGGIPIGSFVRKLLFAIRFGEIKILLSNDLTAESRIMIYRAVVERVRQVAPFFRFDRDPYMVVTDDGRLVWMLDGYTTTTRYPYSDPVPGVGNYVRNSVKVTIDAYDGAVRFYLADATDPIVRAYARAFPGLLQPFDAMPADLRAHIRYPEDFFAIQARKYATYHMGDPQVFYNKEDLWTVPRRTVDGREREMEPYYTIMRLPGEKKEEFILLTLYNPSRRANMIAWLAARSDPPNYGKLLVYDFPKQKLVFGPRQIDARIDQDPVISQQLSLWNQRGSTVIRGSLLAIPIDQSLIYVQPLYLAASEQGALPELRRVIVSYGNQIAMEPTLQQSLARIFGGRAPGPARAVGALPPTALEAAATRQLAQRAWEIWSRAQDALRRGDWATYGAEQKRLEETLRTLTESK